MLTQMVYSPGFFFLTQKLSHKHCTIKKTDFFPFKSIHSQTERNIRSVNIKVFVYRKINICCSHDITDSVISQKYINIYKYI